MSILLILFSTYLFDNYQLKSSFAIEDTKTISNDIEKLIKQGDYNLDIRRDYQAIKWYDEVLVIDSENVDTLSKKSIALSRLGNFSQALNLVNNALPLDPNDVDVLHEKGRILINQGNYSEALDNYDKALEINPNDAENPTSKGDTFYN